MKDIDFDELDRAVSSLMGEVPKDEPAGNEPGNLGSAGTAVSVSVDSDDSKQSEPDKPVASVGKPSRKPMRSGSVHSSQSSAATRRGRYMDMVRPASSDASPVAEQSKSRKGVALEPMPESSTEETKDPVEDAPSTSNSTSPDTELSAASGDMPDPLADFTSPPDEEVSSEESSDTEAPLSSPFLPDAKVEKRPLGRLGDELSEAATENSESAPSVSSIDSSATENTELKPESNTRDDTAEDKASSGDEFMTPLTDSASSSKDAQLPEQPLPAELGSEILNIESSMSGMPEQPVVSTEEAKDVPTSKTPAKVKKPPVVAASIPQQYKLKSKPDTDQPSGTIYDTSAYHQPIDHPDKKKPGWLIVVAIILVGLAGLAAGIAFYYFMYS